MCRSLRLKKCGSLRILIFFFLNQVRIITSICIMNELLHWAHSECAEVCTHLQSKTNSSCSCFPAGDGVCLAVKHKPGEKSEHQSSSPVFLATSANGEEQQLQPNQLCSEFLAV